MIGIIDYGLGNLTSVKGALNRLGFESIVCSNSAELMTADRLILPGVGAFGDGMKNLRSRGFLDSLEKLVRKNGVPILGICLGFQLIASQSEEFGFHEGLGWVDAKVCRLQPSDPDLRVPHVGWNNLEQIQSCPLFEDVPSDALFYYVHSFAMDSSAAEAVVGECDYGGRFPAAIAQDNIFAVQFHPEKSQRHGLTLLKNFVSLT